MLITREGLGRLDAVLAAIDANPEKWDQTYWAQKPADESSPDCGTAYCLAGWLVVLSGATILWDEDDFVWSDDDETRIMQAAYCEADDGDELSISDLANRLLGGPNVKPYGVDSFKDLFGVAHTRESLQAARDELALQLEQSEAQTEVAT